MQGCGFATFKPDPDHLDTDPPENQIKPKEATLLMIEFSNWKKRKENFDGYKIKNPPGRFFSKYSRIFQMVKKSTNNEKVKSSFTVKGPEPSFTYMQERLG